MGESITLEVSREDIIEAVKRMKTKDREAFVEDLLAATSPDYVSSIKEARADYKAGRVKKHDEVFGK
jgi:hypothetical protein